MPRRYRNRRSKARKARRFQRRRIPRGVRGINDAGQMARIKETVEFTDLNPNLGYNFNFNLSQFIRAAAIAPHFKFYKATKVEWTIFPLYNTFQDGTGGGEVSIPYLYMTMNRTQDTTGINLLDIQAMGAKPKKLSSKHVIKYTPNWCVPGLMGNWNTSPTVPNIAQGLKAVYDWIVCPDNNPGKNTGSPQQPAGAAPGVITNYQNVPNLCLYNGHSVFVDQSVNTGTLQAVARVVCTVHWAFKGPHYTYAQSQNIDVAPKE